MATINNFKILSKKCEKMFSYLKDEFHIKSDLTKLEKERIGFYNLILEIICRSDDLDKCVITDTDYGKIIGIKKGNDLGIDAVFIPEHPDKNDEYNIKLFNFKYREKFDEESHITEDTLKDSIKFFQILYSNEVVKDYSESYLEIEKIRELEKSTKIINITLYIVTNNNNKFNSENDSWLKAYCSENGISLEIITLDEISEFFSNRPEKYTSKVTVHGDEMLKFSNDSLSTETSYIMKISLLELLRITSRE